MAEAVTLKKPEVNRTLATANNRILDDETRVGILIVVIFRELLYYACEAEIQLCEFEIQPKLRLFHRNRLGPMGSFLLAIKMKKEKGAVVPLHRNLLSFL